MIQKPKHPGGRPPKPANERASADINIRTTKATKAKLKAAAKVCRVTLSAFVLAAAMRELSAPRLPTPDNSADAPKA